MELQYLFNDTAINTFMDPENNPWFRGKDVAIILCYKNPQKAIRDHIDIEDKVEFSELISEDNSKNYTYNHLNRIYINKKGLTSLLQKSKICRDNDETVNEIIKTFDLNLNLVTQTWEQKTLIPIYKSLRKHYKCEFQYSVLNYKVDLYLPEIKLAIECDEYNHTGYNITSDKNRENKIKEKLNCKFFRYNPNASKFCIYETIGDVHKFISQIGLRLTMKN